MNQTVTLCLCSAPPLLGVLALAVAHLRAREWWQAVLWVSLPALTILGFAAADSRPRSIPLCVGTVALATTAALIVEIRGVRKQRQQAARPPGS